MKCVLKEVSFDGINFWLRDLRIGKIKKNLQFCSPIPQDIMHDEKMRCIGKIIGVEG